VHVHAGRLDGQARLPRRATYAARDVGDERPARREWRRATDVDVLDDLRDAVIGDGLLLIAGHDGPMRLYTVAGGRARPLGTFTDAGTAWKDLDTSDTARVDADRRQRRS
jgi:hypothetical protein